MNSWKKTPVFKKWRSNIEKYKKRKTLKKRSNKDVCNEPHFCKGAKDIPRNLMPQIYDAKAFAKTIKKKYDVNSKFTKAPMANFKPSQDEINKDRVDSVIEAIKNKKMDDNPIVVSKDKFIIDGHHRWAAYKNFAPKKAVPIMIIQKPVQEALGLAIATSTNREKFG